MAAGLPVRPAGYAYRWAANDQTVNEIGGSLAGEWAMNETVEYEYTPEFVRKVSGEFLWRTMGLPFGLSALLAVFALISVLRGNKGFVEGVLITQFALLVLIVINYVKQAWKQAKSSLGRSVTVNFDDDGITFNSIDHLATVKWRRFHSITKLNSAWLFSIYGGSDYTAIPADHLNTPIKALIEKKMAENNKIIK
jgi:hypothetical protein